MSGSAPYQFTTAYAEKIQALPGSRYRLWCLAWYAAWLLVSAVFGYYLIASWWQGVLVGVVTGLPLLLRFRQPAWLGLVAATDDEPARVVGGYTAAANWSTPLSNITAVRVGRSAVTEQLQVVVEDREAIATYNRKGLSRALTSGCWRYAKSVKIAWRDRRGDRNGLSWRRGR